MQWYLSIQRSLVETIRRHRSVRLPKRASLTLLGLESCERRYALAATALPIDTSDILAVGTAVPTAPLLPIATATTESSVTLSWQLPSTPGGTITDYVIQYKLPWENQWTTYTRPASTALQATVAPLRGGSKYAFQVAAKNPSGTGAWSTSVSAMTDYGDTLSFYKPSLYQASITVDYLVPDSNGTLSKLTASTSMTASDTYQSLSCPSFKQSATTLSITVRSFEGGMGSVVTTFDVAKRGAYQIRVNSAGPSGPLSASCTDVATPLTVATGSSLTGAVPAGTTLFIKRGGGTLSLNSASSHSGGTVIEGGAVVIQRADAIGTGFLDLRANTNVALATGTTVVDVPELFFAPSAVLDIKQAGLSFGGMNESGVRALVLAGRGGGGWDGSSGIRSTNVEIGRRTVGFMTDGVTSTVRLVAPGDSNLDGLIDVLDAANILSSGRFDAGISTSWNQGDFNYDGVSDILDAAEFMSTGLFDAGSYIASQSAQASAVAASASTTSDVIDIASWAVAVEVPTSSTNTARRNAFATLIRR